MTGSDPIEQFLTRLATSLTDGSFVRLAMSMEEGPPEAPRKILGRLVELKGAPHLSLSFRGNTRESTRNFPVPEVADVIRYHLKSTTSALLGTTRRDWQLVLSGDAPARLVPHRNAGTIAPPRTHDRQKQTWLDETARPWLHGLGLVDANGGVPPSQSAKHHQVSRYLEILSHLVADCGWTEGEPGKGPLLMVADMGCGKGHLTFGAWHLLRQCSSRPIHVVGVEARPELVESAQALATRLESVGLAFEAGTIASARFERLDALIALHACNTATDDAIRRGIELGASLILVAPCCHQEIRPQLGHPHPLGPVLEHGIMAERMAEWVTDGLRVLALQWAGYHTRLIEFVGSEHTPKNLLLAAVRREPPFRDPHALARLEAFREFFGIRQHALDSLLQAPAGS